MKEQHFDKLFRERLAGFTQAPPPGAIDRFNVQVKQRHQKVWIKFSRLAAALALIALSVYLFNIRSHRENEHLSSQVTESLPEIPVNHPKLPDATAGSEEIESTIPITAGEPSKTIETKEPVTHQEITVAETEEQFVSDATDNQATLNKPKRAKVTITYKKGPDPESATLAEHQQPKSKSSSIRKILQTAHQVDYHSFSLAGIRTTKDQLLAINKKERNKETKPD